MDWESFKVIENLNGTIRKLGYSFLFAFHSNYSLWLCIIFEIKRLLAENRNFFLPRAFDAPVMGAPCRNIAIPFGREN